MDITQHIATATSLPNWVPILAQIYLAHTHVAYQFGPWHAYRAAMPQLFCAKFARWKPAVMTLWLTPFFIN